MYVLVCRGGGEKGSHSTTHLLTPTPPIYLPHLFTPPCMLTPTLTFLPTILDILHPPFIHPIPTYLSYPCLLIATPLFYPTHLLFTRPLVAYPTFLPPPLFISYPPYGQPIPTYTPNPASLPPPPPSPFYRHPCLSNTHLFTLSCIHSGLSNNIQYYLTITNTTKTNLTQISLIENMPHPETRYITTSM